MVVELCRKMEREREAALRRIGTLSEKVLARVSPIRVGNELCAWPAQAVGKQRLIRRNESVLLITDGISNPWDPELHRSHPEWRFGFEAAVEVPLDEFDPRSAQSVEERIASSWAPRFLWSATDWIVTERFDLKAQLLRFGCATVAVPPIEGLETLTSWNGFVGVLVGLPFSGSRLEHHYKLCDEPDEPGEAVWLLPLKILTADEYEWTTRVRDSSRAVVLAKTFLQRDRHLSRLERSSVLSRRAHYIGAPIDA